MVSNTVVLFGVAVGIRIILLCFGEWQDNNLVVKYTDIDYEVFTDATRYVMKGESPYERATYRYTPLLAFLLIPNILIHKSIGKFMFAAFDILIGILLFAIISLDRRSPSIVFNAELIERKKTDKRKTDDIQKNSSPSLRGIDDMKNLFKSSMVYQLFSTIMKFVTRGKSIDDIDPRLYCVTFWLFNPFAINVSTRGNAESIMGVLVLLVLYFLFKRFYTLSAICFGIAVHFKIYPIIYALPIILWMDNGTHQKEDKSIFGKIVSFFTLDRIKYGVISGGVFFALIGIMYYWYGYPFLHESYLYHIIRSDHRHNLSVYFYFLYLQSATSSSSWAALLAFLPQLVLIVAASLCFAKRDLPLCLFIQTVMFVTFNKVCTVQYFIWYFSLLPLVIPTTSITWKGGSLIFVGWLGSQLLWLSMAYYLEFEGENTFFSIWLAGLLFFLSNIIGMFYLIVYSKS